MKSLTLFSLLLYCCSLTAQIDTLFFEGFDTHQWVMSTYTYPVQSPTPVYYPKFRFDSVIYKSGSGAATDTVGYATSSNLMTPPLSFRDSLGNIYPHMSFQFDQICYIDWFDQAIIEYSIGNRQFRRFPKDVTINNIHHSIYLGSSNYNSSLYFSKISQPVLWRFHDSAFIWTPQNSVNAWQRESFDVSTILQWESAENNVPIQSFDSIQFRLVLHDDIASPIGRTGTHQWWVDNVQFLAAGNTVGIEEEEKSIQFSIAPNPSSGVIEINGLSEAQRHTYQVYTLTGQLQREGVIQNGLLDLRELTNGVYLLQISNESSRKTVKFVKK